MLEIFNKDSGTYTFPNGDVKTSDEMKTDPQFSMLFKKDYVVDINDGIFMSCRLLSNLAKDFGLDYSTDDGNDPADILELIKKKQEDLSNAHTVANFPDVTFKAIQFAALNFTDEQALEVRDLYPVFEIGYGYKKDERFTYNGHLFKVNQDHTSQEQWVPGETGTESLYTSLEMGENGHLNWQQPTGSHDAYNTGDIVNYKGELYKSLIDGNTWAPDVYPAGWEKYTEPTS